MLFHQRQSLVDLFLCQAQIQCQFNQRLEPYANRSSSEQSAEQPVCGARVGSPQGWLPGRALSLVSGLKLFADIHFLDECKKARDAGCCHPGPKLMTGRSIKTVNLGFAEYPALR
jgi:hypothetical protein